MISLAACAVGKDLAGILATVRARGVRLWLESGELRYSAPKGSLTASDVEILGAWREQIVALLECSGRDPTMRPRMEPRRQNESAPLTYFQTLRWDGGRLYDRSPIRQIASATRLRGQLDTVTLHASFHQVICRHDALRARIVVLDGAPAQVTDDGIEVDLVEHDLSELPANMREGRMQHLIHELILEAFRIDRGPLVGARLIKLEEEEHVLVLALEHIVADAYSLNVLLRDLFAIYAEKVTGVQSTLPALPLQLPDYAAWQRSVAQRRHATHMAYWQELKSSRLLRLPMERTAAVSNEVGWGAVRVQIEPDLKARLREWCRLRGTTLAMAVFSAYTALVLRWCDAASGVIRYISDGRTMPEIQDAIGPFAAPLYLLMTLKDQYTFIDLLNSVTEQYCRAHAHADFFYLQAREPDAEPARSCIFNWVAREPVADTSMLAGSCHALACSEVAFTNPLYATFDMDSEPMVLMYDREAQVDGEVMFARKRFPAATMERFARNLLQLLTALLAAPEQLVSAVRLD